VRKSRDIEVHYDVERRVIKTKLPVVLMRTGRSSKKEYYVVHLLIPKELVVKFEGGLQLNIRDIIIEKKIEEVEVEIPIDQFLPPR